MDFQTQKACVRAYFAAIEASDSEKIGETLREFTAPDWVWRGFHPFNERIGAEAVAQTFWGPLLSACHHLQRRQDIFFAGLNTCDGFESVWVVSMGHFVGLFDAPFLGIPPTGRMAFLRYCEFNRVADNKILETACYVDLPHLMAQAGLSVFPKSRGAELVQPGPITHDGILYDPSDPSEGQKTLELIEAMGRDLGQWQLGLPLEEELARTWHNDMIWWGPAGIGATYTIPRYAQQHSGPFRAAFKERTQTCHISRLAEGSYGGFFGWPNFTAKLKSDFLGVAPAKTEDDDIRGEFRVIDIYRRSGDKLAENWVFIDLLHWMKQHGRDVLPL